MRHLAHTASLLFLAAACSAAVQGNTFSLRCSDSGQYSSTGKHQASVRNYLCGDSINYDGKTYRNFFTFNLATVPRDIASAKMVLFTGNCFDPDNSHARFGLFFPGLNAEIVRAGGSTMVATFNALGSGPLIGEKWIGNLDDSKLVNIPLSATFVALANSARQSASSAEIVLGGVHQSLNSTDDQEALFGYTGSKYTPFANIPRLELVLTPQ